MTIVSKYRSVCKACGGQIEAGETINWHGRGKGSSHAVCPANPTPPTRAGNGGSANGAPRERKPRISKGKAFAAALVYLKAEVDAGSQNEFILSVARQAVTDGGLTERQLEVITNRIAESKEKAAAAKTTASLPEVPAGRYAVKMKGAWCLFRVWRGTRGANPPIHVYAVQGTEKGERLEPKQEAAALKAIAKDPGAAAIAFGHRTGSCSKCGKELDVNLSRLMGIGPVCVKHWYGADSTAMVADARGQLRAAGLEPTDSNDDLSELID